ncbi:MAG TPA: MBL fold metallo-hydrolase, partial [Longimicrobiaceae bacterium]|nr:MBL fold metallo-hydrolase [Longimicrobiaceae bacterium]
MSKSAGLRVVRAPNPSPMTLDGTRTFLVGRERPAVIDPGPADERHLAAILSTLGEARPAAILLTHAHPDHAALAPQLARATGAVVMMGRGALDPSLDPAGVDRWLEEGEEIKTDAGPLRVLATPGHVPEHLAFLWRGGEAPPAGALFVGDLLMGEGDTTLVAPPEGDLAAYLHTLERIGELSPGVLYPAHGPALADPAAAVARFLAHRRERIEQVTRALRAVGVATPAELVESVYGAALHPELRAAAEGSIRAILRYLDEEGRVRHAGEGRYGT